MKPTPIDISIRREEVRPPPEVARLLDSVVNPRIHVYRHMEMWESWTVLAKAGKNPSIYTRWKRGAWEGINRPCASFAEYEGPGYVDLEKIR